ncbi:DivIVA domain-containing protein [Micromonospora endophytica]|nr:DivIVA domain-containing protein [Micromonospora endophytica]
MFNLFRPDRSSRSPNGGWFRSATGPRLTPGQIRAQRFRSVPGGLDPEEVYAYLHRVAAELACVRRDLVTVVEENVRVKRALRSWRTRCTPEGWR